MTATVQRHGEEAHQRQYGLFQSGAAIADADCAIVVVHGRDRGAEELPQAILERAGDRRLSVLAPWVEPRLWYDERYDAPLHENANARDAGLATIAAAVALAADQGRCPVILTGFSQGGCMVAEFLLTGGARNVAAAAIFTGSLLAPAQRRGGRPVALRGLPVMLSGGLGDAWLPAGDLARTGDILAAHGAQVDVATYPDQDHVVRPDEIDRLLALVPQPGSANPDRPVLTGLIPAL